jgi:hypothetical protein
MPEITDERLAELRALTEAARKRPPRHRADGIGLLDRALEALGITGTENPA